MALIIIFLLINPFLWRPAAILVQPELVLCIWNGLLKVVVIFPTSSLLPGLLHWRGMLKCYCTNMTTTTPAFVGTKFGTQFDTF
jgi:hypothetical protein